jgi:hypothetical protein
MAGFCVTLKQLNGTATLIFVPPNGKEPSEGGINGEHYFTNLTDAAMCALKAKAAVSSRDEGAAPAPAPKKRSRSSSSNKRGGGGSPIQSQPTIVAEPVPKKQRIQPTSVSVLPVPKKQRIQPTSVAVSQASSPGLGATVAVPTIVAEEPEYPLNSLNLRTVYGWSYEKGKGLQGWIFIRPGAKAPKDGGEILKDWFDGEESALECAKLKKVGQRIGNTNLVYTGHVDDDDEYSNSPSAPAMSTITGYIDLR